MGALAIEPVSLVNLNLRDGDGMIIAPLDYGQHEIHLKITRDSDLAPQRLGLRRRGKILRRGEVPRCGGG